MNKLLLRIFVVLVVLLFSNVILASDHSTPSLSFKEGDSDSVILKVSALNHPIQIVLQEYDGGLLFTETLVKGYSYRKNYNLSDFNDGVYYMKIVEATNVKFFKIEKGLRNNISEVDKLPFE